MADNTTLNPGSGGDVIAKDDDGTAKHQYVKVEFGGDGTFTKVTSSVGLPVSDAGGSLTVDGTVGVSGTVTVDGSGSTQPVSAASLPLPSGAATAAKQPALGTAGTPSTDVITVQGHGSGTALPVSVASIPSHAVTNAGTFATQAAQSGTWTVQPGNTANTTAWKVDGSAVTQPVSGTVSITANSAVNVAQMNGVTTAMGSGASSTGTQRVILSTDSALAANQSVNISQMNGVATTMGNGASGTGVQRVTIANDSTGVLATVSTVTTLTGGGIAHDAADSGNPLKVGAKAETSPKGITLVADGDRTDLYADADGLLLVKVNTSGADAVSEAISNTDGSSTAFTNFSAVASTKNYITSYTAFRTDAGTSMAYIDLRDGTAGSVLWRIPLPPTGGAVSPPYQGPCLFKTSANTALAYDVSSALTTVYLSVSGYQSKV